MGDGGEVHTIYLLNTLKPLHDLGIPWSKMHIEKEMTTQLMNTKGKITNKGLTPDITVDATKDYEAFVVEIETDSFNEKIKRERYERIHKKVLFIEPKDSWKLLDNTFTVDIRDILEDIQIQLEAQIHKVDKRAIRSKRESEYRKKLKEGRR